MLIVIPLAIIGAIVAAAYGMYRATRKWGIAAFMFLGSGLSFLGSSGVLAEHFFGPRWSWNFAHHGWVYAYCAFAEGIFFLALGLGYRTWGPRTRKN